MKYLVEIFDQYLFLTKRPERLNIQTDLERGQDVCFFSSSRNSRKHLRDRLPPSSAAKCIVYSADGEKVISACAYDDTGVIKYISW